jgi:hypothetical protein
MKSKRIAIAVLGLAVLLAPTATALAKELGRVVISGPGLSSPIEITDPEIASQLGPDNLDNFEMQINTPPAHPGDSFYTIDRSYPGPNGQMVGTDHLRYYPNPDTGHGLIFYVGMDKGYSSQTGHWFAAKPEGETLLLKLLAEHGVTFAASVKLALQAAQPEVAAQPAPDIQPAATPAPTANLPLIVGGLALLSGIAIGITLARVRARRTKA